MKRDRHIKKPPAKTFEARYRSSVKEYAIHGGESGLRQAYQLGREAIEAGTSLTEIASLHHEALRALVKGQKTFQVQAELLQAGAAFLVETMSPYEMAHRGFQDAVKALRQVNETLEEEIKRIAYAVHDEAGQLLVAGHLALAELSRDLPKPQQEKLERIEQLLDQVQKQLRKYSHELRPTILDDLGWIPALRFLVDGVSKRSRLPIEIDANVAGRLSSAAEIALYRVVQEALANATRHAGAKHVSIRIRRLRGKLSCTVRDDGAGFDVSAVQADRKRTGLGLIAMKERLHAVGGTFSIDSAPGRGTTLSIEVPAIQE
ncbi:MAG: ATP-binding protein [Candidatus Acidiferrales bacterium]